MEDANKKAFLAKTLSLKNPSIYGKIYERLMASIDQEKLDPKVKSYLTTTWSVKEEFLLTLIQDEV